MWWWKKKAEEPVKIRNVFTVPSDEAQMYLSRVIDDVKTIMQNDRFMEASKKVKLPDNAGLADYEKLIKDTIPSKISSFLSLFIVDCYDNVRRILASLMATDFDEYKNKTLEEMCEDFATLNIAEVTKLIRFFIH